MVSKKEKKMQKFKFKLCNIEFQLKTKKIRHMLGLKHGLQSTFWYDENMNSSTQEKFIMNFNSILFNAFQ